MNRSKEIKKYILLIILLCIGLAANAQFLINNGDLKVRKCPLDTSLLVASPGYTNYEWYTAAAPTTILSTNDSIDVITLPNQFGVYYFCTALNGATPVKDSIYVEYLSFGKINLGNDSALCNGDSLILRNKQFNIGNFTYNWLPTMTTNDSLTVYTSGTYILEMQGPIPTSTCINRDTVVVSFTPNAYFSAGNDTLICYGDAVQLKATLVAAGVAPYYYTWTDLNTSNVVGTDSLLNIAPTVTTTYNLKVQDSGGGGGGCMSNSNVTINVNPQLVLSTTFTDSTICKFTAVTLGANLSGGSGSSSSTTYNWSPIAGLNDPALQNPTASITGNTTYTVIAADSIGCNTTASVNLSASSLSGSIANDTIPLCMGSSTTLGAVVTGGSPTYTMQWTGALSFNNNSDDTTSAITSTSTFAYFRVTDSNNCSDLDSIYIDVKSLPTVDIFTLRDSICQGNTMPVSADANGGSGSGYTFSWTPALTSTLSNDTSTLNFSSFNSGIVRIYVRVTDANFCVSTPDSLPVKMLSAPYVNLGGADTFICANTSLVMQGPTGSGFTYAWKDSLANTSLGTNSSITVTTAGIYTLSATGPNGCRNTDYKEVKYIPLLDITAASVSDTLINQGESITLSAQANTASVYSWTTTGTGTFSASTDSVTDYASAATDNGILSFTVKIKNQCAELDTTFRVRVGKNLLFIPTVFSPSSTLIDNQTFKIFGNNLSPDNFSMKVVNKWGSVVYETSDLKEATSTGWNPSSATEGVYTVLVKVKFNDGTENIVPQTVTLMR